MATVAGTIYLTGCNYQLQYDGIKQSIENNTTTVNLYGVLNVTNNYISWSRGSAWVHGSSNSISTYYSKGSYTLVSGTYTFSHNDDGTCSIAPGYGLNTSYVSGSATAVITFPTIPRYAYITSTSESTYTDESEFTFNYTNPGVATDLNCWLEVNPNGDHIASRTGLSTTSGSYTWELKDSEKEQLRNAMTDSSTGIIRIGLNSTIGSATSASYVDRTYKIINADPTYEKTSLETNEKVAAVYGTSGTTLLQNKSSVKFTITPTALKGATISSVSMTHNGILSKKTEAPYEFTFTPVNNTFNVTVTDSRGNTNTTDTSFTVDLVEYNPLNETSLSITRVNPTSSNINIKLESVYTSGTFNGKTNSLTMTYSIDGGTTKKTLSGYDTSVAGKVTLNKTISNLIDYQSSGTVTIYVDDLFSHIDGSKTITKGIPTAEMGDNDFQVNGDLLIADTVGENAINVLDNLDLKLNITDIKLQKLEKAIYVGANAMTSMSMGSFTTPDGYNPLGVLPYQNGYGDQWVVSYSFYGSNNVQVMVHSQYGAGLSNTLVCYIIFVKQSAYNSMIIS